VSTSYGFGIFDLVQCKTIYSAPASVPSGKLTDLVLRDRIVLLLCHAHVLSVLTH